jgi:hypothetical protein
MGFANSSYLRSQDDADLRRVMIVADAKGESERHGSHHPP